MKTIRPSKVDWVKNLYLGIVLFPLIVLLLDKRIITALIANLGRIEFIEATPCDVSKSFCRSLIRAYPPIRSKFWPPLVWKKNQDQLKNAKILLETAYRIEPDLPRLVEHIAMVNFSLNNRQFSARIVNANQVNAQGGFWSLSNPQADLLRAYENIDESNWNSAIIYFQSSLNDGVAIWNSEDYQKYSFALSKNYQLEAMEQNRLDLFYLAGKYAYLAGEYLFVDQLFEQIVKEDISKLDAPIQADIYRIRGMMYFNNGDLLRAKEDLIHSFSINPNDFRTYEMLINNSDQFGLNSSKIAELTEMLPKSPSIFIREPLRSQLSGNMQQVLPFKIDENKDLIGLDILDKEALEMGVEVPVALWWKIAEGKTNEINCMPLNYMCIEIRVVRNLAPNAGYEWAIGETKKGTIPGYPFNPFADPQLINVSTWDRQIDYTTKLIGNDIEKSHVLSLGSPGESEGLGSRSYAIPIDPAQLYVFSGWIDSSEGGNPAFGCMWVGDHVAYGTGQEYGWVTSYALDLSWTSYAGVIKPNLFSSACQIMTINIGGTTGSVRFDDLLFFELDTKSR